MIARAAIGILLSAFCVGCYVHHGRDSDRDAAPEASIDASDAAVEASVDAASICETFTLRQAPIQAPLDIVWAIDSSRSMQDERERLNATINDFAMRVQRQVDDLHVVVITAENLVPPPLGTDAQRYLFVPLYIDSPDTLRALTDNLPLYRSFLRDDALLHFVVVSDDDSTLLATDFIAEADRLLGRPFTVHAIASPDVDGQPCRSEVPSPLCLQTGIQAVCGAAAIGRQYYAAAERTGGVAVDLCVDDWSRVLGPLSDALVGSEPIACRTPLTLRRHGQPALRVEAQLVVSGLSPQVLRQVPSAAACNGGLVDELLFYRETTTSPSEETFVMCPWTCSEVERRGGMIEVRLDCE